MIPFIYFPDHINSKENYFLQFNGGIHEDFSSIVTLVKNTDPKLGNIDSSRHQQVCKLTVMFFNQYMKNNTDITIAKYIQNLVAEKPRKYSQDNPKR